MDFQNIIYAQPVHMTDHQAQSYILNLLCLSNRLEDRTAHTVPSTGHRQYYTQVDNLKGNNHLIRGNKASSDFRVSFKKLQRDKMLAQKMTEHEVLFFYWHFHCYWLLLCIRSQDRQSDAIYSWWMPLNSDQGPQPLWTINLIFAQHLVQVADS